MVITIKTLENCEQNRLKPKGCCSPRIQFAFDWRINYKVNNKFYFTILKVIVKAIVF